MKVFVSTSKKYSFLLEPYSVLFNKHWPGQEIVFLGFDECDVPTLPDNCSFVSLGAQAKYGRIWSTPLIPYMKEVKDEYFVFTVEDIMLIDKVDTDKVALLVNEIEAGASKAHLDKTLSNRASPLPSNPLILGVHPDASYRTSLAPSIWTKRYFMKYLKPNMSIWDFEKDNMERARNDGNLIVCLNDEKDLYYNCNVFLKGKPFPRPECKRLYGTSSDSISSSAMQDIEYLLQVLEDNKEKY